MVTDPELLRLANESGFPLQIAIEHVVRQTSAAHGWQVRHSEHAWHNPADGQSGFIDLVLSDSNGFAYAVVECKRVRNTTWLFFAGTGSLARDITAGLGRRTIEMAPSTRLVGSKSRSILLRPKRISVLYEVNRRTTEIPSSSE